MAKWRVYALHKYFRFFFILNSVMANITKGGQFVPTAIIAINCPPLLESSHFHLYIFVPAVLSARNVLPSLLSRNGNHFSKPRSHFTSPTNTQETSSYGFLLWINRECFIRNCGLSEWDGAKDQLVQSRSRLPSDVVSMVMPPRPGDLEGRQGNFRSCDFLLPLISHLFSSSCWSWSNLWESDSN